MNQLQLFLPCAAGVEGFLADEVHRLTGLAGMDLQTLRGGVLVRASWREALRLNLHSRLAQRVLVQLSHTPYRSEGDLYQAASEVAWEIWFTTRQTFKIEVTAQHSPLQSLNFAALKIKDAVADRFRHKRGERPSVETRWPDVRIHAHVTDGKLHRELTFANFSEAFGFMARVAMIAEKLDHHPDWSNSWNKVTIDVVSHSDGGITETCLDFAARVNKLLG